MSEDTLLTVADLWVDFQTERGTVEAVQGVSFQLTEGESLALLGESGSGKTVTGRSILGLVDQPGQVRGSIRYGAEEIVGMSENALQSIRGIGISMVFQDSLDSLNPVYSVGSQITEILRVRLGWNRSRARTEALRLMDAVGIPDPARRINDYPHQFSGGMRQRVCIAMAIALKPRLLIADEPTTALDVTVQAGILRLLTKLRRETSMALIFVTHDLAVARLVADDVAVMYDGKIVERGRLADVFENPQHSYTKALLAAHPASATRWQDLRSFSERGPADQSAPLGQGPAEPHLVDHGAHHDIH